MKIKLVTILLIMLWQLALTPCMAENIVYKAETSPLKDIPNEAWERLARKKIFFGHKSVGVNIMAGVQDLMKEFPQIKLNIMETNHLSDFDHPLFAHYEIGQNSVPGSKLDRFEKSLAGGIGEKADIAFFKYCFVDVIESTDIEKLFDDYKSKINLLKQEYPGIVIITASVPLTINPTGIKKMVNLLKSGVKKILGLYDWNVFFDNRNRNRFNDMLRKEFGQDAFFWDIAKAESTRPDGSQEIYTESGKQYVSMVPLYTDDGGHLNEYGRKKVAEQLLMTLVKIP